MIIESAETLFVIVTSYQDRLLEPDGVFYELSLCSHDRNIL